MPSAWKLHEFAKYYNEFRTICFYDSTTNSGGYRNVYEMLSVLPRDYRSAVNFHDAVEVYYRYIAYMAEITFNDREPYSLDDAVKLLKSPSSLPFRNYFSLGAKTGVCLAVTFQRFALHHVKYDLLTKEAKYVFAAHAMYLASMMLLNLLGYNYYVEDEQRELNRMLREARP